MNNQVFYTVTSGTLVFVIGQILQKFFLEPIYEYKKTIGEIDNKLKFYANILTNSGFNQKIILEITNTMRTLSCQIESNYKQIPFTDFLSRIGCIEGKKEIAEVAQGLIFLSNAGGRGESKIEKCDERIDQIRKIFKIESLN
ncbi:MAG: hypothetical protein AABY32_06265 [Nanoarchaeota archaeon]